MAAGWIGEERTEASCHLACYDDCWHLNPSKAVTGCCLVRPWAGIVIVTGAEVEVFPVVCTITILEAASTITCTTSTGCLHSTNCC